MARVLVVDDNPEIIALVKLQLANAGHEVMTAASASEALFVIATNGRPDVAVFDVAMPRITGLKLLETLRATDETSDLPVVFLSALASGHDVAAGRDLGAIYLTKPHSSKQLLAAIDQCLEGGSPKKASHNGSANPALASHKILVVDDDADLLKLLQIQLSRSGFTVMAASNGPSALATVVEHGVPDVAILDVAMPKMTGLELLGLLRGPSGSANLPAIFLSARVSREDVLAGRDLGAIYLTKPYVLASLLGAIEQCLDGGCPPSRVASAVQARSA